MANRFGQNYNTFGLPDTYYSFPPSPLAERMLGRTRIHEDIRKAQAAMKAKRRAIDDQKKQNDEKKRFVESGSGHMTMTSFCTPVAKKNSTTDIAATVTDCSKKTCTSPPESPTQVLNEEDPTQPFYKEEGELSETDVNKICEEIRTFDEEDELEEEQGSSGDFEHMTATASGGVPIYSKEGELLGIEYKKEHVVKRMVASSDVTCAGCGNCREHCHNKLFGTFLIHEMISYVEGIDPSNVKEWVVEYEFHQKYLQFLRFYCFMEYGKYDTKRDYKLPECLKADALSFAQMFVKHETKMFYYSQQRETAVADTFLDNKYN